jgi:hypothetical protein
MIQNGKEKLSKPVYLVLAGNIGDIWKTRLKKCWALFGPLLINRVKVRPLTFPAPPNFFRPFLRFAAPDQGYWVVKGVWYVAELWKEMKQKRGKRSKWTSFVIKNEGRAGWKGKVRLD